MDNLILRYEINNRQKKEEELFAILYEENEQLKQSVEK